MDVVVVSQYLRDIENFDNNNSRFVYISRLLCDKGVNVEIITSDFDHSTKKHFGRVGCIEGITVTALHESGYPKNVCLKRFASHKELANNLKKYLSDRKKPDVLYVAVPSLDVAKVCSDYCNNSKVRFIIDIQDLWPEAFKMVFNIPVLSNIIFAPMKAQADYIYSAADEVIAVSKTYTERGMSVNKKCPMGHTVFLGTRLSIFDENAEENKVERDTSFIRLGYCGTLGASYDLTCVFDALEIIIKRGKTPPKFIVMGNGPRKEEFEAYALSKKLDVEFTGRMPYDQMCGMLRSCDIVVNPITKGATGSIINKHADYAASGLPVINTQESAEYRDLVAKYNMGFNCENGNSEEVADRIIELIEDEELRLTMGKNARRCAEDRFDRKVSYLNIIKLIME